MQDERQEKQEKHERRDGEYKALGEIGEHWKKIESKAEPGQVGEGRRCHLKHRSVEKII